eukprot:TRINITY_DN2316_c0_g1_i18.p1 TRINITY_DN2316_c0_g1~~TRINITY_DN2316_c0_g1_i18.p1  ORF type:complete len:371 (-),score=85.15 TRINITY_DN2316_c0_g1_i18:30-1142(-)
MYLIGALLEENVPELSGCLKSSGVTWNYLIREFVLTLGTSCTPTDFVPQVFDVFFMDGWIGLYRIAAALFNKCAAEICKVTPDNCITTLKKAVTNKDMQEVLQYSTQIQVSKVFLEKSFDSFFIEEATKYLDKKFNPKEWPDEFAKFLQASSEKVSELTEQHEVDMKFFSQKLIKLEASLLEYSAPNFRSRKHLDRLKAQYVEMCLGHEGLKDQRFALESTRSALSKGAKANGNNVSSIVFGEPFVEKVGRRSMGKTMTVGSITLGNENEIEKEDLEVINKKIRVSDCKIKETTSELREKSKEIEEAKADINEYRMRWDMLQAQINKLYEQKNTRIHAIYKQVGDQIKAQSKLSTDLFSITCNHSFLTYS